MFCWFLNEQIPQFSSPVFFKKHSAFTGQFSERFWSGDKAVRGEAPNCESHLVFARLHNRH